MTVRIGIRELRNETSRAVELALSEGEVVITSHGKPVAVIRPYVESWKERSLALLHASAEPTDSGLADLLADDDALSMGDLD